MSVNLPKVLHFAFFVLLLVHNHQTENTDVAKEVSSLVDYSFKSLDKSFKTKFDLKNLIPKIPKHIRLYIAAAFSEHDFPSYSKMFNKTLSGMANSFLVPDSLNRNYNISISPLFFVLPNSGRFSSSIYEVMCHSFYNKRVAAILVIGESPAAFTVSMAASTSNVPVLWARGGPPSPPGSLLQQDSLEVRLEPYEFHLFEAVRGVLLATHWHSFTVMAAPALATRCARILDQPPLNPKVVPFSRNPHSIFRKLADVSRATRGVVMLLCDITDALLVMDVAKRLNMVDGHFVWLWIDTTTKPASFLSIPVVPTQNLTQKTTRYMETVTQQKAKNKKSDFVFQKDSPDSSKINADKSTANQKYARANSEENKGANTFGNKPRARRMIGKRGKHETPYEWKNRRRRFAGGNETKETVAKGGNRFVNATQTPEINAISDATKHDAPNISSPGESDAGQLTNRTKLNKIFSVVIKPGLPSKVPKTQNAQISTKTNRKSAKEGKLPRRGEARKWAEFTSLDYVNDFAVQLDIPEDNEEEKEEGEEDEAPMSKAWGRITEHFPFRPFGRADDRDKMPRDTSLPLGMLAVKPEPVKLDRHLVKGSVRLLVNSLHSALRKTADWINALDSDTSCWDKPDPRNHNFSVIYAREIKQSVKATLSGLVQYQEGDRADRSLLANFQILNLVPEKFNVNYQSEANIIEDAVLFWRQVGKVTGRSAHLDTIVWPGGDLIASALSARTKSVFRIVTALAPPFVMEGALDEDGQCLRGVICHRVLNSDKDNLTLVFNEMDTQERQEEEEEELGGDERTEKPFGFLDSPYFELHSTKYRYKSSCCYGLAMDLLENIAQELQFEFHLYITPDGFYGSRNHVWEGGGPRSKWNGVVGDLVSGAAHMSFAALSVSKQRSQVIDFSTPYFYSGVSFLAAPSQKSEVPLLAFLLPFSPELWIAIFTSLNITAMAVACYEWLSPFGLNPWGRQRSRNFSIASALWVMWGLLCGHLVAFKAPKSWPNKFLINVWGGFSVIFVASYTANIAALIAGLFFHNSVSDYHDRSLLTQRVGAPRASAADYYIHRANPHLWEHMQKFSFKDVEAGITLLKNGSLDILIADSPILDYYRATDHGCKLQKIVEAINEDTYAIGMNKGFPLKESISAVISKYSNNGYMDILTEKWYGGLPCFKMMPPVELDVAQPRPLGVAAVAGVFILLGLGMFVGILILIMEHLFYRYTLPVLRHQPKGTIWRSRNIMFFSQKLYRFINCVELVSPHHAARELVNTLRQGQITSLFQKSVKRKEHEQRRRRKSKAQFFEMIQEIRRVQQEERDEPKLEEITEITESPKSPLRSFLTSPRSLKQHFCSSKPAVSPQLSADLADVLNPNESIHQRRTSKSPSRLDIRRFSRELFSLPRSPKSPKAKSSTSLDVRRFSSDLDDKKSKNELRTSKTDVRLSAKDIRIQTSNAIGRRLSKDATGWLTNSPPDLNARRKSHLDITRTKSLSVSQNLLDEAPRSPSELNPTKFFTLGPAKGNPNAKYNEYGKELLSKSMTLTPVISKAATLRLASSGSLDTPKSVKARPRLPSPPPSPVMEFRNPKAPKISISDASGENINVYDVIVPQSDDSGSQKPKTTHSRSKSLDNKHLNFGVSIVNIEETPKKVPDTQTINYATLEHKKTNLEAKKEPERSRSTEKFANVKSINAAASERGNGSRSPIGKHVPLPTVDTKKAFSKDLKTKPSTKTEEAKSGGEVRKPTTAVKHNEYRAAAPEPSNEKPTYSGMTQHQKQNILKSEKVRDKKEEHPSRKSTEAKPPEPASKPKVPPKSNALKQMQTRAYSAPEAGFKQAPTTVIFIPEENFKKQGYQDCGYYPEHRRCQKSDSAPPDRHHQSRYPERCFETFPLDRRCAGGVVHPESQHRSRCETERRYGSAGRSSSVPEQRYIVTAATGAPDEYYRSKRRPDNPVVVMQHSSRSLDTPSRSTGILKNRRRSRSREYEGDLPPAPPSPPERSSRHERSESQTNREILLTIKKQGHGGYVEPP